MSLNIIRVLFLLVILAIAVSVAFDPDVSKRGDQGYSMLFIVVPMIAGVSLVLLDVFWKRKQLQVLSGLFFGILAGLVLAYAMGMVVDLIIEVFPMATDVFAARLIKGLLGAASVFLCVTFVMQTKDDFRFVIPYVEFSKETKGVRPTILDTSVIIDGRISEIADTGIFDTNVLVPRFILTELQSVADSDDTLKRGRGRHGLDVLNNMQASDAIDIKIIDPQVPPVVEAVGDDAKLVALAEHLGGRLVTTDYNLNKVAQLRGVDVININDLANALKPVVLPGEMMDVKIVKPGEEAGQGVGYLPDGTMVVVENSRQSIGQDISLTVTSVLQTSAGRMIFGRCEGNSA